MALDLNVAALLVVDVLWQPKTGLGDRGQDTWGDAITLQCYPAFGAMQVQKNDGTVYTSTVALYFDANDSRVQQFELGDRFTSPGIAGGQTLEAQRIEPTYSPGPDLGDAMTPWLVEVSL